MREYTARDLVKAYLRAQDRGPEAVEQFKARLNEASCRLLHYGDPSAVAFFDLFADNPEDMEND